MKTHYFFRRYATLFAVVVPVLIATISCSDDDEPDPVITAQNFEVTIDENPEAGAEIGTLVASTNKGSLTFAIKSQSVAGAFAIDESSAVISVGDEEKFDFETNPVLTAVVSVKSGNVVKDVNVTVNLQKTIWEGPEVTFTKTHGADWTLAANQDKITNKVTLTRQNSGPIYNYQFWQDAFGIDPTKDDITDDFWNGTGSELEFTRSGGTHGVRWALLDETGGTTEAWGNFELYGTLGDPAHFYSFHNIASIITALENNDEVNGVLDDFGLVVNGEDDEDSGTMMPLLVGKKLGVWLVEEDIYLTLTFTHWGSNGDDNGVAYERSSKD